MKRRTKHRQTRLKTKLGLPDLEHAKLAVTVSLRSFEEFEQIEMELAKQEAHLPLLPPFPQKPYKASTIVLFSVFGFFVAFAARVRFKELVIPFFR
jgi:hypothetical protein